MDDQNLHFQKVKDLGEVLLIHQMSSFKADLHQKKVMISIWWDWKGILYYELFPPNKTINSYVYCEQLDKLKKEIEKITPRIGQLEGRRLPS